MSRLSQSTILQLAQHRATRSRMSARRDRITLTADHMLAASRFSSHAIRALSHRSRFPEAAHFFASIAEPDRTQNFELPGLLHESTEGPLRLWRLAMCFGLESQTSDRTLRPLSLTELRQRARTEPAARMTLAAYGEIQWSVASARERAAYCLHALVVALRRAGAS
jgi:hypothetical protein